jgi:hypothetical protein
MKFQGSVIKNHAESVVRFATNFFDADSRNRLSAGFFGFSLGISFRGGDRNRFCYKALIIVSAIPLPAPLQGASAG